jgi:hypothetical protein
VTAAVGPHRELREVRGRRRQRRHQRQPLKAARIPPRQRGARVELAAAALGDETFDVREPLIGAPVRRERAGVLGQIRRAQQFRRFRDAGRVWRDVERPTR